MDVYLVGTKVMRKCKLKAYGAVMGGVLSISKGQQRRLCALQWWFVAESKSYYSELGWKGPAAHSRYFAPSWTCTGF